MPQFILFVDDEVLFDVDGGDFTSNTAEPFYLCDNLSCVRSASSDSGSSDTTCGGIPIDTGDGQGCAYFHKWNGMGNF